MILRRTSVVGEMLTVSPGQRARLTRGPSGLLSILQSNVAHPVEPAAITAPGVVRATGGDSPPASDPRHPSNVWSAVAHGAPSGVPKTDEHTLYVAVENASMVSNAPDDAATALSRMAIAPQIERTPVTLNLDNDLDLPQADIGTESSVQTVFPPSGDGAGGRAGTSGLIPLTPALSQWERETKGAAGPVAPLIMGPMPQVDETFPPSAWTCPAG